jgi:hypothetical protein
MSPLCFQFLEVCIWQCRGVCHATYIAATSSPQSRGWATCPPVFATPLAGSHIHGGQKGTGEMPGWCGFGRGMYKEGEDNHERC